MRKSDVVGADARWACCRAGRARSRGGRCGAKALGSPCSPGAGVVDEKDAAQREEAAQPAPPRRSSAARPRRRRSSRGRARRRSPGSSARTRLGRSRAGALVRCTSSHDQRAGAVARAGPVWLPVSSTRGSNAPASPNACAGRGSKTTSASPSESARSASAGGRDRTRFLVAERGAPRERRRCPGTPSELSGTPASFARPHECAPLPRHAACWTCCPCPPRALSFVS